MAKKENREVIAFKIYNIKNIRRQYRKIDETLQNISAFSHTIEIQFYPKLVDSPCIKFSLICYLSSKEAGT